MEYTTYTYCKLGMVYYSLLTLQYGVYVQWDIMEYICIYIYRGEFSVFSINTYKLWDLMDTMVIEL